MTDSLPAAHSKLTQPEEPDNGPGFRYYRTMQPRRISILGVGLLGGSIGLGVRSITKDCRIIGYGHRRATLDTALKIGAIHEAYDQLSPAVRDADLVILCTPVGLFRQLLHNLGPLLGPQVIVTDVGSTKRSIVAAAEELPPNPSRFIGSHPIAGSEKRGIEHARADLYRGALCILTPTARTSPQVLAEVREFWHMLGMRTCEISPDEHDRRLADVSHLPHAVAASLIALQDDPSFALSGKGLLDMTRIASGDANLWRDIFLDNRDYLKASLAGLQRQISTLEELLDPGKAEALQAWLEQASQRRQKMLEEHQ